MIEEHVLDGSCSPDPRLHRTPRIESNGSEMGEILVFVRVLGMSGKVGGDSKVKCPKNN